MKKFFFILILLQCCVLSSFAVSTTITSYIRTDTSFVTPYSYISPSELPSTHRRVKMINHAPEIPELETAMTYASIIFTDAMMKINYDLNSIYAEVSLEDLGGDSTILCKVEVVYNDTMGNVSYYPLLNSITHNSYPVLIPKALSNQTTGFTDGVAMRIKLRPNVKYHCTLDQSEENEYDAITILLRALVMGCGVQSTFNISNSNIGIMIDGTRYINVYDAIIFNEDDIPLTNIADGSISANNFFSGKSVYALGKHNSHDTLIHLFNNKELVPTDPYTDLILNTVSPDIYTEEELEEGMYDLLDVYLPPFASIRDLTPYSKALIKGIGWIRDIPVGFNPFEELYNCDLVCSSRILYPNTIYTVDVNREGVTLSDIVCELHTLDSTYTLADVNYITSSFTYSNLPDNVQWKRNPITKNIIGQIKAKASMFIDGRFIEIPKFYDIEIPYRPNKPIVQRNEEFDAQYISINLSAFANGSDTYTVSYTGVSDSIENSFVITSDAVDTVLELPATQYYDVSVYGTNSQGNSDTYNFTAGGSIPVEVYLNLFITSSYLRYSITFSNENMSPYAQIGSATISNIQGTYSLPITEAPGVNIPISFLPRGYYVFSVTVNGNVYSKLFYKR